jgi:hypothetical protein
MRKEEEFALSETEEETMGDTIGNSINIRKTHAIEPKVDGINNAIQESQEENDKEREKIKHQYRILIRNIMDLNKRIDNKMDEFNEEKEIFQELEGKGFIPAPNGPQCPYCKANYKGKLNIEDIENLMNKHMEEVHILRHMSPGMSILLTIYETQWWLDHTR